MFVVRFKLVPNEVYEKSKACTTDKSIPCSYYIALIDAATMLCLVLYLQANTVRGLLKYE